MFLYIFATFWFCLYIIIGGSLFEGYLDVSFVLEFLEWTQFLGDDSRADKRELSIDWGHVFVVTIRFPYA